MEAVYSPDADREMKQLSQKVRNKVKDKVEELKDNPTGHEDSKLIQVKGREVYRLEIREERGGEIDHRLIYDIEDGKIRIYSVFNRDQGYDHTSRNI